MPHCRRRRVRAAPVAAPLPAPPRAPPAPSLRFGRAYQYRRVQRPRSRHSGENPGAASADVTGRQTALLQILLMVILSLVKSRSGRDLGDYRPGVFPALVPLLLRRDRRSLLLIVVI